MFKNKKFIFIALLTVAVLGAVLGGVAIARADEPPASKVSIMDKVAEIYQRNTGVAIDSAELQKAFTAAGQELRIEAQDTMIDRMVEAGKLTEEQAAEFKAWLNAMPTTPDAEFKAWLDSRPDGVPFGPMMRGGAGGFGGMFGGRGSMGGTFGGGMHGRFLPKTDLK